MRVGNMFWKFPVVNPITYYMSLVFVILNVITCLLLAYVPIFENVLLPEPMTGIVEYKPNIFGKNLEILNESTKDVQSHKKDVVELKSNTRHGITDKYKNFLESKYNTEKARSIK